MSGIVFIFAASMAAFDFFRIFMMSRVRSLFCEKIESLFKKKNIPGPCRNVNARKLKKDSINE